MKFCWKIEKCFDCTKTWAQLQFFRDDWTNITFKNSGKSSLSEALDVCIYLLDKEMTVLNTKARVLTILFECKRQILHLRKLLKGSFSRYHPDCAIAPIYSVIGIPRAVGEPNVQANFLFNFCVFAQLSVFQLSHRFRLTLPNVFSINRGIRKNLLNTYFADKLKKFVSETNLHLAPNINN